MIEQLPTNDPKNLAFRISGKLQEPDYEHFVPTVEKTINQQGKINILVHFDDFHGWDMHALWEDIKFDVRHWKDFDKIAMIGDKKWEEWMAKFCKPFTTGEVKYFDASEQAEAWKWLGEVKAQ